MTFLEGLLALWLLWTTFIVGGYLVARIERPHGWKEVGMGWDYMLRCWMWPPAFFDDD